MGHGGAGAVLFVIGQKIHDLSLRNGDTFICHKNTAEKVNYPLNCDNFISFCHEQQIVAKTSKASQNK